MRKQIFAALCLLVFIASGLLVKSADATAFSFSPFKVQVKALTIRDMDRVFVRERATTDAARLYRRLGCSTQYAELTARNAVENRLPVRILVALVVVESSCRSNAVSSKDCVGLTQINPRIWKHSRSELLDPEKNVEIGAKILADYSRRHGLREGLHRYHGLGDDGQAYINRILVLSQVKA